MRAIGQEGGPRVVDLAARDVHLRDRCGGTTGLRYLPYGPARAAAPAAHDDVALRAPTAEAARVAGKGAERFRRSTGDGHFPDLTADAEGEVTAVGRPERLQSTLRARQTPPLERAEVANP